MELIASTTSCCHPGLPHPIFRRKSKDMTIGLRNTTSHRSIWVRGCQVFRKCSSTTTGKTTSSEDSFGNNVFFLNVNNLFGDIDDNANANAHAAPDACDIVLSRDFARVSCYSNQIGCDMFIMFRCNMFIVPMITLISIFMIIILLLFYLD
jgi:hypothetical protein